MIECISGTKLIGTDSQVPAAQSVDSAAVRAGKRGQVESMWVAQIIMKKRR